MANWREELSEAVKTKAERDAEEAARLKQRVQEALGTAESAFGLAMEALRFAAAKIGEKGKAVKLEPQAGDPSAGAKLVIEISAAPGQTGDFGPLVLGLSIDRETAVLKASIGETKPREFDFAKDRHIAASDVEEYVGRRIIELVRAAQKASAW
jgi:hypothetical protein